jgi:CheY-like chemotaxis protein/HPt (histidine-containing phosphotransfer) domain-containing protein
MRPVSVDSAQRAFAALEGARQKNQEFALIIVDIHLPDLDGFQLLERIAKDCPSRVIVLLDSYRYHADVIRCRNLGIFRSIWKPIETKTLRRLIFSALGQPIKEEIKESGAQLILPGKPKTLRILVAEDNAVNQRTVVGMLREMGHSASVAVNGEEALTCLSNQHFDLVLMDVQMPVMDGLEATRKIRETEIHSSLRMPIIAMTAHATKEYEHRCKEAGMDGYVPKPASRQKIEDAIEYVLATSKAPTVHKGHHSSRNGPWNPERLRDRIGGDDNLIVEISCIFLEESPKQLRMLKQAIIEPNAEAVERIAHTIKGEFGCLDNPSASDCARQIEEIARSGQLDRIREPLRALENEIQEVSVEMKRFIEQKRSSKVVKSAD